MFSLYISPTKFTLLELTPASEGKFTLSRVHEGDLPHQNLKDAQLIKPKEIAGAINKFIKEEDDLTLILPEAAYFTSRLTLPANSTEETVNATAFKQLGLSPDDFFSASKVIKKEAKEWFFIHIAVPKTYIMQYETLLSHLNTPASHVFPESVAAFPILKSAVKGNDVVAYLANPTSLIFVDSLGPISSNSLPDEENIEKEVIGAVNDFFKQTKEKVKSLVISSSLASHFNKLDVEMTPTSHLLEQKISSIAPQGMEGLSLDTLNPASLGLFLLDPTTTIDLLPQKSQPSTKPQIPLTEVLKSEAPPQTEAVPPLRTVSGAGRPGRNSMKTLLPVIGAFILGCLLTFGAMSLLGRGGSSPLVAEPTPTPEPSPTASPTPIAIDRSGLKVRILNGTKTAGLAAKMSDFLKGLGYESVTTGNAQTDTLVKSTLEVKEAKTDIAAGIAGDISPNIPGIEGKDTLDEDSDFDAIITLGQDFVASGSPTPTE